MRRVLLLAAALAAPALAAAQTTNPGSGVVTNGTTQGANEPIRDDKYVNIDECNDAKDQTAKFALELIWNAKLNANMTANGGNFRLFASNTAPGTTEPRYCPNQDAANGVYTAQIGTDVTATVNDMSGTTNVPPAQIPAAAHYACTEGQSDQTIQVCVTYLDKDGNQAGWALGTLILSLRRPPPPSGTVTVSGGDGALEVAWGVAPDPTGSQAPATGYRVNVARASDGAQVATRDVTTTSARITGLQNGVDYDVKVNSTSAAFNLSTDALTGSGQPVPVLTFWDWYHDAYPGGYDGQEQGGCGTGGEGPLALLGVAAVLRRLRRRA